MLHVDLDDPNDDCFSLGDYAYDDADFDVVQRMIEADDVAGVTAWIEGRGATGAVMTEEEFARSEIEAYEFLAEFCAEIGEEPPLPGVIPDPESMPHSLV